MPRRSSSAVLSILSAMVLLCVPVLAAEPVEVSGRYPHLAMSTNNGECGTGAVVPWADRLWVITYGPHMPNGSEDKLYEINDQLQRTIRPESVGGTPANRMIHSESNQLMIGPYLIDANRNVRVISPKVMPGRLTANARHLTDPANMLYVYDMEGMLYEINVHTLDVKRLYARALPGWHGKGGYSSQGRLVLANNGEEVASTAKQIGTFQYQVKFETGGENAGGLGDWDGKSWRLIERRQFTEVTGPGGIRGPASPDAPIWTVGWDRRSLLLKLLDGDWHTFRLPKADYSYDGTHGWHTEWPRIRQVTNDKYLMNMHGGWFDFPATFSKANTSGLRPLGAYAKVTGDFAPWKNHIVFGCDDTAKSGFKGSKQFDTLNTLNGRSVSNLWFATWDRIKSNSRFAGGGGPWIKDPVKAQTPSDPYHFAGYEQRTLHLALQSDQPVTFTLEMMDAKGKWSKYQDIPVAAKGAAFHVFPAKLEGEWIRLTADKDCTASAYFNYGPGGGFETKPAKFAALADINDSGPWTQAVMKIEASDDIKLAVMARTVDAAGKPSEPKYYQVDADLAFKPVASDSAAAKVLQEKTQVGEPNFKVEPSSVLVTEGSKRFRLPKTDAAYDQPFATGWGRFLREVVTERALYNVHGTIYIIPRDNSGGVARIKPMTTHLKRITDFASWRGLIVLSGTKASAKPDGQFFASNDPGVGLWFGDIDDLWQMGKPRGHGGPWLDSAVTPDQPSDPYLMHGYDRKTLSLSHDASKPVQFTIEVDPTGYGDFQVYQTLAVPAGQTLKHEFPQGYQAHWFRVRVDAACKASAIAVYE